MENNIPIVRAVIKTDKQGLRILSMVNEPAIMINLVQMAEEKERIKMSVVDEEQGIIIAPALVPDLFIKRFDKANNPYYLVFDKDVILEFAIKASKDNTTANIDTDHDGKLVSDVIVFEKVVTDEKRFSNPKGFEHLPTGTLFFSAKINNPTQLAKVKAGEINGWSIDGMFDFELKEMLDEKEILSMIEEILT